MKTREPSRLAKVMTYKSGALIRVRSNISIPCRLDGEMVDKRTPALFEPVFDGAFAKDLKVKDTIVNLKKGSKRMFVTVTNDSDRDVKLDGNTWMGDLQLVSSITPVQVSFKEASSAENKSEGEDGGDDNVANSMQNRESDGEECDHMLLGSVEVSSHEAAALYQEQLNTIDLSMLKVDEQELVREMLWEERKAFSCNEDDIGDVPDMNLELKTTDEVPVQNNYNAIWRPLFDEVNHHVQDLLNRGWITRSKSTWSSPVVLVRKKDGNLRICCDFRALNAKSIPDKHPLP